MNLKPLFDRVILKNIKQKNMTKSGIFIPETVGDEPILAEVVAVGPGGFVDGNEIKMYVKVGDKVITGKYSGTEVKMENVEYTIVRQSEILAIVE